MTSSTTFRTHHKDLVSPITRQAVDYQCHGLLVGLVLRLGTVSMCMATGLGLNATRKTRGTSNQHFLLIALISAYQPAEGLFTA